MGLLKLVNHHHIQIAEVRSEPLPQLTRAVDVGDFLTCKGRRLAKLLFQIGTVIDETDLVVL